MKLYDQTSEVCESSHINEIFIYLNSILDNKWGLYVRQHNQSEQTIETDRAIVIIISAEGHAYIPPEINSEKVDAVFMHYLKKKNSKFPYFFHPGNFDRVAKLFELQLGTTKWFSGDNKIEIKNRKYDLSFIGQYDPYTRTDFYHALNNLSKKYNSKIHFYEGWNKGFGGKVYSEIMSDTKIALVPFGSASLDTFRFYEAMKCGCIVLTIGQNEYEFMKESPHIEIDAWKNLDMYLDDLLNDNEKMHILSEKSYSFWHNNLSPWASAKYILSKINKV